MDHATRAVGILSMTRVIEAHNTEDLLFVTRFTKLIQIAHE